MSDFGLKYDAQKSFFDKDAVLHAMDYATLKVLRQAGGTTRKIARNSMKKSDVAAKPGRPPTYHVGDLRDKLWFAMGPDRKSVVIGPVKFEKRRPYEKFSGTLPGLMEEGGPVDLTEQQFHPGGQWYRVGISGPKAAAITRVTKVEYAQHPYMAPALAIVQPTLPGLWANSVKPHG